MNALIDSAKLGLQQRSHRIQVLPIIIVYLNNVCDSRCGTCAIWKNNDVLNNPLERQMTDTLLEELYRDLRKWHPRQILLSGGEPALHPRFPESVRNFAGMAKVCVISNGLVLSALDPGDLNHAAAFYLSFDAPDRESYERIRGVDGFLRLAAAVQSLRSLASRPAIVARCTLQRANVSRIPELVEAARKMGFDKISFLGVDVSSQAFSRDVHGLSGIDAVVPTPAQVAAMKQDIELVRENGSFIEGGRQKLSQILQYFRALLGETEFPLVHCNAPWVSMVVETTGKIRGCFFQPRIGDLHSVNGDSAISFRRSLDVGSDRTCQRCVCSKVLGAREFLREFS